ncbi:hypothetical protein [Nocardioides sp.]|uniref:hypothetical protein n=1 Tax=Nocardioides sp. TaxID=35761 RepID=UPI0035674269
MTYEAPLTIGSWIVAAAFATGWLLRQFKPDLMRWADRWARKAEREEEAKAEERERHYAWLEAEVVRLREELIALRNELHAAIADAFQVRTDATISSLRLYEYALRTLPIARNGPPDPAWPDPPEPDFRPRNAQNGL